MRASRSASRRGAERSITACGKRQHLTWASAAREAQMVRRHKDGVVEAYHCRICQCFHVGGADVKRGSPRG